MTKPSTPIGTICYTGDECPESAVWKVIALKNEDEEWIAVEQRETIPLTKDKTFPPYSHAAARYELEQYA